VNNVSQLTAEARSRELAFTLVEMREKVSQKGLPDQFLPERRGFGGAQVEAAEDNRQVFCCFIHQKLKQHPTRSHRPLSKTMPENKELAKSRNAPEPVALPSRGGSLLKEVEMT